MLTYNDFVIPFFGCKYTRRIDKEVRAWVELPDADDPCPEQCLVVSDMQNERSINYRFPIDTVVVVKEKLC
jgi:hypothetical protein